MPTTPPVLTDVGWRARRDVRLDAGGMPGVQQRVHADLVHDGRDRRRLALGAWSNDCPPAGQGKAGLHVDTIEHLGGTCGASRARSPW